MGAAMKVSTAAVSVVLICAGAIAASAQSPSPYDRTFALRGGTEAVLYADMSASSSKKGVLPAGASGIVLRWCRSEFDFGKWQFGTLKDQLKYLDARWCEVSYKGVVGNVPGSVLTPE
jgi:hypothetical protein